MCPCNIAGLTGHSSLKTGHGRTVARLTCTAIHRASLRLRTSARDFALHTGVAVDTHYAAVAKDQHAITQTASAASRVVALARGTRECGQDMTCPPSPLVPRPLLLPPTPLYPYWRVAMLCHRPNSRHLNLPGRCVCQLLPRAAQHPTCTCLALSHRACFASHPTKQTPSPAPPRSAQGSQL